MGTLRLFHEIKNSLLSAVADGDALTVGIDTWGVDYAYLDVNGALFSPQYHYRDGRTEGMEREFFSKMPYSELYALSGIQSQSINTLYQLAADMKYRPLCRIMHHVRYGLRICSGISLPEKG